MSRRRPLIFPSRRCLCRFRALASFWAVLCDFCSARWLARKKVPRKEANSWAAELTSRGRLLADSFRAASVAQGATARKESKPKPTDDDADAERTTSDAQMIDCTRRRALLHSLGSLSRRRLSLAPIAQSIAQIGRRRRSHSSAPANSSLHLPCSGIKLRKVSPRIRLLARSLPFSRSLSSLMIGRANLRDAPAQFYRSLESRALAQLAACAAERRCDLATGRRGSLNLGTER